MGPFLPGGSPGKIFTGDGEGFLFVKRVLRGVLAQGVEREGPKGSANVLVEGLSEYFATNSNLHRRHITGDATCPICMREEETIGHILWSCPSAQDVWMDCNKKFQKSVSDEGEFASIVSNLLEKLEGDGVSLLAAVVRQIWFRRNAIVFGGEMYPSGGDSNSKGPIKKF